ncbi:hypothetical protein [Mycobacterium sp.]|uniref:hypothetical protein n=1 Tax=Mycobacterium sp. TaxID=1785 RepID=UPI003F96BD33
MNTASSLTATLVGAALAVSLVGCSNSGTTTSSTTPTASTTTTTGQSASLSSSSATTSASPVPQATTKGSAGGIDVTITAPGPTAVRPGGAPMPFSVTLLNTTTASIAQLGMVVSLGHCSCNPSGAAMMPAGTMQLQSSDTNAWVTVPYVAEGTGTDFLAQPLLAPLTLAQGQTITYQLQLQLNPNQNFTVNQGASAVDVTMTNVTTNTPIGASPTASLPISVGP